MRRPAPTVTGRNDRPPCHRDRAALRWIIQQPGATTVIAGARSAEPARANAAAAGLPPLPEPTPAAVPGRYERRIRPQVHDRR